MFNEDKVKLFITNTRSNTGEYVSVNAKFEEKNIEITLSTKADDVITAEEKTLEKVKKLLTDGLAGGKIKDNFKLQTQSAEVVLQSAKNDPVTGIKQAEKRACEVSVDLVVYGEKEENLLGNPVKQQVVVSRRDEKDFDVAEDKAINRALALLGY